MKALMKVLFALLAFAAVPAAWAVDFWLEPQIVRTNGRTDSQVDGGFSGTITGQLGYYCFGQALSIGYRQAYCGPNLKPTEWLEIGVGAGQETAATPNRRNAYFNIDTEKFTIFGTFENGGSGSWHRIMATYKVNDTIAAGVIDQALFGLGPVATYKVNKKVTFLGAVARDRELGTWSSKISLIYNFNL